MDLGGMNLGRYDENLAMDHPETWYISFPLAYVNAHTAVCPQVPLNMPTMTLSEHPKRSKFLHVWSGCVLSHYLNSYKDQVYISACISSMNMVIFNELLRRPVFSWCLQHSYIFASSDVKINECTDSAKK
jgi:hypothetical protein